jgi:hypothetical protein
MNAVRKICSSENHLKILICHFAVNFFLMKLILQSHWTCKTCINNTLLYNSPPLIRSSHQRPPRPSKATPPITGHPSHQRPPLLSKATPPIKGHPSHQRPPLPSEATPPIKGHPSHQRPPLLSKVTPPIKGHLSYQAIIHMHWDSKILQSYSL